MQMSRKWHVSIGMRVSNEPVAFRILGPIRSDLLNVNTFEYHP